MQGQDYIEEAPFLGVYGWLLEFFTYTPKSLVGTCLSPSPISADFVS